MANADKERRYGRPSRPLHGTAGWLRLTYERLRQARWRLALVLATDFGSDLDCQLIGARKVAA
ncbi:hypothetical protein P3T35_006285 [Kitasatospora sp. GP30]|uniref:hypothetical protein n=1 Tax=Kitasatospora sp. GP30 TaxID=3035084 RepID=UPI00117BF8CB|nr:hypothetical protein [Kitasatospora sp. GP30]MDH6144246.1 hypothetical protein [Kitasatospora sp. GP30]